MINSYDQRVKEFISEWETDHDFFRHTIKAGITGLIIPFIYKSIREELLSEIPIPLKGSGKPPFTKIRDIMVHACWYFVWTIKWFLFISFISAPQKIVITCFFRKSQIVKHQLQLLNSPEMYFINFSLLYNAGLLMDLHFYCYPYAFFRKKSPPLDNENIIRTYNVLFRKYFRIDFTFEKQLKHFTTLLNNIHFSFLHQLNKLCTIHSCVCLFQDCDYLAERVILTQICNMKEIPSVVTDHSVLLVNHLFRDCHSKYALVWGEHQKNRIRNYSSLQPDKIIITGRPKIEKLYKTNNRKKQTWVYFLPAFQEAHIQSFSRRIDDSISRFNELRIYSTNLIGTITLLIKSHPSDEISIFPLSLRKYLTCKSLNELASLCCLAFTEDSTISLELLRYDIPVVYLAGKGNADPLQINNAGPDYIFCPFNEPIRNILCGLKPADRGKRYELYKYYFGRGNTQGIKFLDLIKQTHDTL